MYEYLCEKCGRFEKIQKFSDKPLRVCPTCKGRKVQRLLSAPAIQFKGSGWYITDYARKGDGKGKDVSSDGAQKSDSTSSSASNSTPEKSTSEKSASKEKRASKTSTTQN